MSKKTIYTILLVFFVAIFVGCVVWLAAYFIDRAQSNEVYNNLASMMGTRPPATQNSTQKPTISIPTTGVTIPTQGTTSNGTIPVIPGTTNTLPGTIPTVPATPPVTTIPIPTPPPTTIPVPTEPSILPELAELYKLNNHLVGRVTIDGTHIDYPVLQTPNAAEWRDYYLYRDFYGNDNRAGAIYVREACNVFAPTDNIVVYGHNMKIIPGQEGSSMFGELTYYKSKGKKFYEAHKYIHFDTLYERHTYEIFSVFVTPGSADQEGYFPFHLFVNALDEADFNQYVKDCKDRSLYSIALTPEYGDKLLCLTTCNNNSPTQNRRLVVMAVRID